MLTNINIEFSNFEDSNIFGIFGEIEKLGMLDILRSNIDICRTIEGLKE